MVKMWIYIEALIREHIHIAIIPEVQNPLLVRLDDGSQSIDEATMIIAIGRGGTRSKHKDREKHDVIKVVSGELKYSFTNHRYIYIYSQSTHTILQVSYTYTYMYICTYVHIRIYIYLSKEPS